jgi:DNA-binding NarL/FixJ family response regulator
MPRTSTVEKATPAEALTTLRVVIADDHPVVAASLCSIVESAGHRVLAAVGDTRGCIDSTLTLRPDLVLVDLRMPGGGGLAACAAILAEQPRTTLVAISADADPAHVRSALDAGCRGFISKMAEPAEILEVLGTAATGELALDRRSATSLVAAARRRDAHTTEYGLTNRELEVLALLAEGLSNPAIAQRLHLSRSTVAESVSAVLRKLQVPDRTAAAVTAWRAGIVGE